MVSGIEQTPVYKHTFKSLSLEGVTINNPGLRLQDNLIQYVQTQQGSGPHLSHFQAGERNADFTLGLKELHHLHVYIAYKEQKLYVTPASAPVTVARGGAPAAKSDSAATSAPGRSHQDE